MHHIPQVSPPTVAHWQQLNQYLIDMHLEMPLTPIKLSRKRELLHLSIPYSAIYLITNVEPRVGAWFFIGQRGSYLGSGYQGRVKMAYGKDGTEYAVKITTLPPVFNPNVLSSEVLCLQDLGHFRGFALREKKQYCLQALVLGVSLESIKDEIKSLPLLDQQYILYLLFLKLYDLHEAQIVHNDLFPANVMVNLKLIEVNIIDFGRSIRKPSNPTLFKNDIKSLVVNICCYFSIEQMTRANLLPVSFSVSCDRVKSIVDFPTDDFLRATLAEIHPLVPRHKVNLCRLL